MSGRGVVSTLRRFEDPARSSDPRIRSLVGSLADLDFAPAPDPLFRSELRAQLVAIAPRIIAESAPSASVQDAAADAAPALGTRSDPAPVADLDRRRRRFGRPVAIAASVAAAFVMFFGAALYLSQKSLPGDALYGLKRASENVRLDLASSGSDRGHLYLSLAQTRVDEARALLTSSDALAGGGTLAGGRLSPGTASLITSTLNSADSDLSDGSSQLNEQAVSSRSSSPLAIMQGWAPGQLTRLHDLLVALPAGSLQNRTKSSWLLTNSALTRAKTLAPAVDSSCLQHAASDKLGPVPCGTGAATTPARTTPGATSRHGSTTPGTGHARSTTGGGAPVSTHRAVTPRAPSTTAPAAPGPTTGAGGLPLPLPLPTKPPLTITSCGISVALGPIGLGVGSCPTTP